MEGERETSASGSEDEIVSIFAEFLTRVVKLEDLANLARTFLIGFQQGLEFLRRPPIDTSSQLVQNLIKENETKRMKAYVGRGCINSHDSVLKLTELNTCSQGLQSHLKQARRLLDELESLMDDASSVVLALIGTSSDSCHSELEQGSEPLLAAASIERTTASAFVKLDAPEYGSLMAVIYGMVKQDFVMQEKIVSSLNLKAPASALETYCLMWSLRPFVNDDIINLALTHVP
ncbi:hypothetical protein Droror1_Dr00004022 [Drosera rotundifolia]